MKYYLFFFVLVLSSQAYAQRIVKNASLLVVDDEYDGTDSLLIKNGYSTRLIYRTEVNSKDKGPETLIRREEYDNTGQLKRLIEGKDILHGKIDLILECNRLSDSIWEALARYPAGSALLTLTSFALDTIINDKREIIPLYKKDTAGNLFIRSVIGKRRDGLPSYAKSYDLRDSLIEIYYANYNGDHKKEWYDTVADAYGRTVNYHMVNKDVIYKFTTICNKNDRLLQRSYVTQNFDNAFYDMGSTMLGYGEDSNVICRIEQGENGQVSLERWYRKDNKLIRYTKDNDLSDDSLNEDCRYDRFGNLVFYESHSFGMLPASEYSYACDVSPQGLCLRKKEYSQGKLTAIQTYSYK